MLPILIPARGSRGADGLLYLGRQPVYCRRLPDDALEAFANEAARKDFERRFGRIPQPHWAGIKAALALVQAIEQRDRRYLRDYASWQATAEVKSEERLAERIIDTFKKAGTRKAFEAALKLSRSGRATAYTHAKAKLDKRISADSPLVAVSELLFQVNRWLNGAQLALYLDRAERKPLPGLYCPDIGTALAALVLNRVPTPRGLGVCRRPSCKKSFLRTREGQQYCSLRCGNADRKARQRARQGR